MRYKLLLSCVVVFGLVAVAWAADPSLEGVNCVIGAKNPAKADNSVDYKGGKVFFCCENCPKAFKADPEKFAVAANHQLAQTKQAKQVACPFSGKALNPELKTTVGGLEVGFCCEGCLGKVVSNPDKAVDLVFADKAFDKGFKVGDEKKE